MSAPSRPRLSVIIVNANTRFWLEKCLGSLCRQEIIGDMEIIVVDNASTDGSVEMVRRDFPCCLVVEPGENLGFGGANNAGAKLSRAPLLLFLNPDTEVPEGSLRELLVFLEANGQYSAAGGKIRDGEGQVERSAGAWPTFASLALDRLLFRWARARRPLERFAHHHWEYGHLRRVGWVTGAYLWIRRDIFEQLGGFDREIFMYYEDVDLCYRVWQAGGQVCFFPGAAIVHYRNRAPIQGRHRKSAQQQGLYQFARKHYPLPQHWLTRLATWWLKTEIFIYK